MKRTVPAALGAYDEVKRRILSGELSGGELLSEAKLGDELGISRTPVHEALMRLDAEGLVSLASRRGVVVQPIQPEEPREVAEMRVAIESSAAESIGRNGATAGLLGELDELLVEQQDAVAAADHTRFLRADEAFHSTVVAAGRNSLAIRFWDTISDRQERLRHRAVTLHPGILPELLADHEALAAALRVDDAAAYRLVLDQHAGRQKGIS